MSKLLRAIFLDSGDTIVDEGTEVKDAQSVVLRAELIPGAATMVQGIKERGYPLALVADGPVGTFQNVLTQHRLYDYFDAFAISGAIGVEKPDARMFNQALQALQITPTEQSRVVMVGNNLARDIKGANALGLITVWLDWAPRRTKVPADASEVPDYTIKTPTELLSLLDKLERDLTISS